MPKNHSELSRVQIPAVYHLERLGYEFLPHIENYDKDTNILSDIFSDSLQRLNPNITELETKQELDSIRRILDNDDLGREFYHRLVATTGLRYIDFENPKNNVWHCTAEFTCENQSSHDNFRPDITCFINGLPIAFIEVKIPNNHDGIIAERDRMNKRMRNTKFRRFLNLTQLMIFSNNQEYDNDNRVPIQGAFYASITKGNIFFNVFREQRQSFYEQLHLGTISETEEQRILKAFNSVVLKSLPEYSTNIRPSTPTNRTISSLLSRDRILFLLRYGFAYVENKVKNDKGEEITTLEKHVMRYQQLFASLAIRRKLDAGVRSGIIWHTQGSGKTALAYYSVKSLTDYFAAKNTVAKFYFIVDRLNLMEQAQKEFVARGLLVRTADSRQELMDDFKDNSGTTNAEGRPEIMVVNIQKLEEDHHKVVIPDDYSINLQRVFFIDEAHRGYNPSGSFLANLMDADQKAIKIALTGTPLLADERASWKVFGDYIDKYYYDKSIADGYTLRLMREDIETNYKEKLIQLLEDQPDNPIVVKTKDVQKNKIIESDNYLEALVEYIDNDLRNFRIAQADKSVAAMIVCETNPQARRLFEVFRDFERGQKKPLTGELILHDEYDKQEREQIVDNYKKTTDLDLLIVNQMLLTGFDAHRLKRMYLTRKLNGHDLLQALTRVNRPYKDFKYGYVVDFAGIKENFDETNDRYLQELNRCDNQMDYDDDEGEKTPMLADAIMADKEAVIEKLENFKDVLFAFTCTNSEAFREEIDAIEDRQQLYEIRHVLEDAKALSNQIRTFGDDDLKEKAAELKVGDIPNLLSEVNHRIDRLNQKEDFEHSEDVSGMVNLILSQIEYDFKKIGSEELKIINNDLKDRYHEVTREFEINIDQVEVKYIDLLDEFRKYFREKGFVANNQAEVKERVGYMDDVMKRIRQINSVNNTLKNKYGNDDRFVRIHKRITEENQKRAAMKAEPVISLKEWVIADGLNKIKDWIDTKIYYNLNLMENEAAFNQEVLSKVSEQLLDMKIGATVADRKFIRDHIANEYLQQFNNMKQAYA